MHRHRLALLIAGGLLLAAATAWAQGFGFGSGTDDVQGGLGTGHPAVAFCLMIDNTAGNFLLIDSTANNCLLIQ